MAKSLKARTIPVGALRVAALFCVAPLSGGAQDGGGIHLTFGIEQRLEANDNLGLDVVSAGTTTQADTRLSFGLLTETRTARLAIDTAAALRAISGPSFTGTEVTLADPRISLAYSLTAADAELNVEARVQATEVEFLRSADEVIGDDGEIVLNEDATGTGTRLSYGLDAELTWGKDAPLGYGLSAGISGLSYFETSSAALVDSQRLYVGASAQMALSDVTEAEVSLRFSTYDDDGTGTTRRDTTSFAAGLTHQRPNGQVTSRVTATDTEDGTRLGLSFGRDLDLPDGTLRASIGAVRGTSGEVNLTGALSYRKDLPLGQIDAELRRSVASGSNDSEQLATALVLGYRQELTPVSAMSLDFSYSQRMPTGPGTSITDGTLSATYHRTLTEDWGLSAGYRHRMRDEDGVGRAHSNSVFVALKREFSIRR